MLHAAWRVFSLSRGACMTWNVFRNGCRTLASEIIWVFHSPFFGSTLLWSRCMPCFEGLLFYDFGAGAQAVLLADAVLIPGLIRISWDEKACCPLNCYECRPLLCRDVFNQMAFILHFFWLLEFQRPYSLGTAWEIWLFHGSSQVCFFIFAHCRQGFLHSFSALPRPAMTSLWRRSSPRCTRRFVRHLPRLIYPARS